jgi:SAM-dependent methyltransferase
MPTEEAIAACYAEYYSTEAVQKVTFDQPARFGSHLLRWIGQYSLADTANVLDFGGGDGTLSLHLGKSLLGDSHKSVRITVVDSSHATCESNNRRVVLKYCADLHCVQGVFDVVVASAVLEHIPAPAQLLRELLGLLRPGGVFYARTPYVLPFIRLFRMLGRKYDFTYPYHLHDLGQPFWDAILTVLKLDGEFHVVASQPAITESAFSKHFFRTLASVAFKAPWRVFGNRYSLVGGWEVFFRRNA